MGGSIVKSVSVVPSFGKSAIANWSVEDIEEALEKTRSISETNVITVSFEEFTKVFAVGATRKEAWALFHPFAERSAQSGKYSTRTSNIMFCYFYLLLHIVFLACELQSHWLNISVVLSNLY